jgi:diguanylate cyclase (GGDEF)-like protein
VAEATIVRFPDGPAPVPTADHLARTWAEAIAGTGIVPMSRRALVALLTGLAADLVATVTAETFDRAVPLRVGGALVDAHFTETASIERTLALLGRELAARTPVEAERLGLMQGAVAAGYARALQDRTRHEQERRSAAAEQARWHRLRHQALHDPLTGLPNRTLFFERLDAALLGRTGPGVCYLDLDGFTEVNDALGHDKGDTLLRIVARHLTEALAGRHLVARMGGDEFVVLVERDADADTLRRVARAVLDAVRRPVWLDDHEVAVSASIGVARADGGQDAAELMKAADATLYWAKADGRNRYAMFDEARHRSDVDRFAVAARMPEALACGEFSLVYQPLVQLADRTAVGVEALVRWTLPGGRLLDPGRFVPLAEESGFIVPLGRWVLAQACRHAAGWAAADPATRPLISVNVAARQLREESYVDDVAAVLDESGWPAELLQLELTESALMGTPDGSLATLHALAGMGVRIAIDDFGTGYSNFAYLRRLPVHALKLAGPFVTGAAAGVEWGEQVDREVVGLVIALAHTLGLTVTAESVETADQYAHLQQLGCDMGQGWFFAVPVPAEQIPRLLARPLGGDG